MAGRRSTILDGGGLEAALERMAAEIIAGPSGDDAPVPAPPLAIIGIRRRGVPIAERLARRIEALAGQRPLTGALDITLYRDDLTLVADQPVVHATEIEFPIDDLRVVLTDDVLYTGRTVRSAIDALFALGRPSRIELAVVVDRGHREMPIEANYVAERVKTTRRQTIEVNLTEVDGTDEVAVVELDEEQR